MRLKSFKFHLKQAIALVKSYGVSPFQLGSFWYIILTIWNIFIYKKVFEPVDDALPSNGVISSPFWPSTNFFSIIHECDPMFLIFLELSKFGVQALPKSFYDFDKA